MVAITSIAVALAVASWMVFVVNAPLLLLIVGDTRLRRRYAVLLVMLATSTFNGLSFGIRMAMSLNQSDLNDTDRIPVAMCYADPTTAIDAVLLGLNGLQLLASSIDRLCAIVFPIAYFFHWLRFAVLIVVVTHVAHAALAATTMLITLEIPDYTATAVCRQAETVPESLYILRISARALASLLSIAVMLYVLRLLRQHVDQKSLTVSPHNVKPFIRMQIAFSRAWLISSVFTFLLYVIPSFVAVYVHAASIPNRYDISSWMRIAIFLNECNIAGVIVYRQRDLRARCMHWARRCLFMKTNAISDASTTKFPRR